MNCKTWLMGALLVLLLTAVGPSNLFADIVNGDFELGDGVGFTSNYTPVAPDLGASSGNPVGMWAEGTYTVATDPKLQHTSWTSFVDHTPTGPGMMLIANGATASGLHVWISDAVALAAGTYELSAWVRATYPTSPAVLDFKVNGTLIGSLTASESAWTQFTGTFSTAGGSGVFSSIDVNVVADGNDFALDDIHLKQVPDGGVTLMLLGGALVGLESLRRKLRA